MENLIQKSMEAVQLLSRQLPVSRGKKKKRISFFPPMTYICYCWLKYILLNNSTCFIFSCEQFFLRILILWFSGHLAQLKAIGDNSLLSLRENIGELQCKEISILELASEDCTSNKLHKQKCL